VGCVIPVLGLLGADTVWVLGMPVAVLVGGVRVAWQAPGPAFAVAVLILPVLGGIVLATTAARWTTAWWTTAPRWERVLVLFAAGTVTTAVAVYALIGSALVLRTLATDATTWAQLRESWTVTGTVMMVVAWFVSLAVVALGCRLAARQ
jgi:hypothetical protein